MKREFITLACALAIACAAMAAHAQAGANGPVETKLEARKVVRGVDGRESFASAEAVKPGDVIEYVATYRNTTGEAVRNLAATLPIPAGTEFIAGSARPATAQASLDAAAFAAIPLKRKAMRAGKQVDETVPVNEYRFLRWYPGELGAQKTLTFSARVKVAE
jgi:uncharacterized repeat protein (TIGR01451 family)